MTTDILTSRFFTSDDPRLDTVAFPLPAHWWSRPYEYAWAAEFCKPTDVVLDAACGIPHPFKFYLAKHSKAVHAVDIDERILDYHKIADAIRETLGKDAEMEYLEKIDWHETINFKQASIKDLPYKNSMFDKVFCISVLEHMPDDDKAKALKEFYRVAKTNGLVVLTLDYSTSPEYATTTMDLIEGLVAEAGFRLAEEKDNAMPANAIHWGNELYCFRMVLRKSR
jgi:ubiquinone/menaquinone biosynthesis C-methylase UbiE